MGREYSREYGINTIIISCYIILSKHDFNSVDFNIHCENPVCMHGSKGIANIDYALAYFNTTNYKSTIWAEIIIVRSFIIRTA